MTTQASRRGGRRLRGVSAGAGRSLDAGLFSDFFGKERVNPLHLVGDSKGREPFGRPRRRIRRIGQRVHAGVRKMKFGDRRAALSGP